MLNHHHKKKRLLRQRESSWDRTGATRDAERIEPGDTHALPNLNGPGIIRHIWMTMDGPSSDFYRELQFVLRFDNAATPQVQLPLADFFLFGHGLLVNVNSAPFKYPGNLILRRNPFGAI